MNDEELNNLMITAIEIFILSFNENTIVDFKNKIDNIEQKLNTIIELLSENSIINELHKRAII